jgi:hypothetical protein
MVSETAEEKLGIYDIQIFSWRELIDGLHILMRGKSLERV